MARMFRADEKFLMDSHWLAAPKEDREWKLRMRAISASNNPLSLYSLLC